MISYLKITQSYIIFLILTLVVNTLPSSTDNLQSPQRMYENLDTDLVQRSQESYNDLMRLSRSNICFRDAVDKLVTHCKIMDDVIQTKLALQLTNCELAKFGKKQHECGEALNLKECSKNLEGDAWNTYSIFYAHLENTCFIYKSSIWYEESERTINRMMQLTSDLAETTDETNERTKSLYDLQSRMENFTKTSLELHAHAIEKFNETSMNLNTFNDRLVQGFNRIIETLTLQEHNFLQLFEKIAKDLRFIKDLQIWLVYESFDFKGLLFYCVLFFVIGFITSYRRFVDLNFTLKIGLIVNYCIEKAIFDVLKKSSLPFYERIELSNTIINYERLLFVGFCLRTLYNQFRTYIDFNKQVLMEVQLLKQRPVYDTPRLKEVLRAQLYSFIKDSKNKFFANKASKEKVIRGNQSLECFEVEECVKISKKLMFE